MNIIWPTDETVVMEATTEKLKKKEENSVEDKTETRKEEIER